MRAGIHTGRPQRIGSDWLGVDVNIAARVMERATRGGLIVSETTLERIPEEELTSLGVTVKRVRRQVFGHRSQRGARPIWRCTGSKLAGTSQPRTSRTTSTCRHSRGRCCLTALTRLARVRVTLGYTAALVAVATALLLLGPARAASRSSGTPVPICTTSATGASARWSAARSSSKPARSTCGCPAWCALLALAELLWRSHRLVVAFVVGHIGATLLVAAGLAAAVERGPAVDVDRRTSPTSA